MCFSHAAKRQQYLLLRIHCGRAEERGAARERSMSGYDPIYKTSRASYLRALEKPNAPAATASNIEALRKEALQREQRNAAKSASYALKSPCHGNGVPKNRPSTASARLEDCGMKRSLPSNVPMRPHHVNVNSLRAPSHSTTEQKEQTACAFPRAYSARTNVGNFVEEAHGAPLRQHGHRWCSEWAARSHEAASAAFFRAG